MTTSYRKKLIEVALPLDAINKEAAREKSIRHGHPSTLHLWWARRPLAACRAVLFASLVDDPGNDLPDKEAEIERKRLFGIIEELVVWENSNDERVLHAAQTEIARSAARTAGVTLPAGELTPAQVREALEKYAPPVLDPFCGGGSIPLEAQRLGLKAYASDLNPVAVLITKALIEIPPKFAGRPPVHPRLDKELFASKWKGAAGLAEDVRYYGQWMRDEAEKRMGHLYPKGPNGETVIVWLWARSVCCPNPACGAQMPLIKTFWLSSKRGKEAWLEPMVDSRSKLVTFNVRTGFPSKPDAVNAGTSFTNEKGQKVKATFRCLVCNNSIVKGEYIDTEADQGRLSIAPLAIVTDGGGHRNYVGFDAENLVAADEAINFLKSNQFDKNLPNQPTRGTFASNAQGRTYGFKTFADYFTLRQLAAISQFGSLVLDTKEIVRLAAVASGWTDDDVSLFEGGHGALAYAESVATYLGLAVDRSTDAWSSLVGWRQSVEATRGTFARQAIAMVWDFAEANPFSNQCGNWSDAGVEWVVRAIAATPAYGNASVQQLDAAKIFPNAKQPMISTDPPYYGNITYADLSDFFYVWLRRILGGLYPTLFSTMLTPKAQELIADPYRFNGNSSAAKDFFESGLGQAFANIQLAQNTHYPVTVYYAYKQLEGGDERDDGEDGEESGQVNQAAASTGWETMLQALIGAGLAVTGTWPMRTERGGRSVSIGANALASSVVLVCRPRPNSAALATRREFIATLKKELPTALINLTHGGIAPVDLAQATIGPGMAVFSRYAKVLEADGTSMGVRTALQLINQELDEYLTAEDGDLDRETRFALAWFQQFGHGDGAFGDADVLARAKDTAVEAMVRAGILHSRAGKVRLLRRGELEEDWDPRIDARLTVWECTQQLIRRLNETGEAGAAKLLKQLGGGRGEDARALAYRLYAICERKKWADEALAYNALVVSWPEIEKKAAGMEGEVEQGRLL